MMVFGIALVVLGTGYAMLIGAFARGFRKVTHRPLLAETNDVPFVTVIVPARDESCCIKACLESILANDYPAGRFEVMVVDDLSEDDTPDVVRRMIAQLGDEQDGKLQLLQMPENLERTRAHKKRAIEKGISVARGDIIMTTDADCLVPDTWIRTAVAMFDDINDDPMVDAVTAFVSSPVLYKTGRGPLMHMQALEFLGLVAVGAGAMCGLAPYKIEHLLIDGYDIVVNKPKVAAYRAPGAPQAAYAVETVMDELAEKLGMDAMDFRLKNASREGDRQAMGVPFGSIGCVEVEEAIKNHPHYKSKLTGPNRGRGVAMGFWFNVGFQSSATINVNTDGTISLITGSVDIGGTRASVSMQAAEILGIAAEDVFPSMGDTDSVGWTGVTGGSRTAFSTGIAAINAAEEVIKIMAQRAAVQWETQPDEVEFKDGVFFSQKNPEDRKTFKELAGSMMMSGGPITASASSNPTGVGSSFSAFLVDVEVDPETGKVDVLRATVFQDVGKAAHPSYVEGQMQGGSV
ncbi:MAG: molybdopterin-dependent oxidoreductase, partial [Chloroflexi bacterium]|nr:molybdopterin-dependent oxidoreductase [Chloroflexota bacterium]